MLSIPVHLFCQYSFEGAAAMYCNVSICVSTFAFFFFFGWSVKALWLEILLVVFEDRICISASRQQTLDKNNYDMFDSD